MLWRDLRGPPGGPVGRSLRFLQFYNGKVDLGAESRSFYHGKVDIGKDSAKFYHGNCYIGARILDTLVKFCGKLRKMTKGSPKVSGDHGNEKYVVVS